MSTLHLEIVTPEALAYQAEVDGVVVPGVEGELGILPQHVPLMTQILPGELRIQQGGKELRLAVGEGFLEVRPDRVSILTDMAIRADDIDEVRAEEARQRAEARLAEKITDEEAARVSAALANVAIQLKVKRQRRK